MATWSLTPSSQTALAGAQTADYTIFKLLGFSGSETLTFADGGGGGTFYVGGIAVTTYTPAPGGGTINFAYENGSAGTYSLTVSSSGESPNPLTATATITGEVFWQPVPPAPPYIGPNTGPGPPAPPPANAPALPTPPTVASAAVVIGGASTGGVSIPGVPAGLWAQEPPYTPPEAPSPFPYALALAQTAPAPAFSAHLFSTEGVLDSTPPPPSTANVFALKFQVLPDNRGMTWREERSVIDSVDPESASAVWFGNQVVMLCTRTVNSVQSVWRIASGSPDDPAGWDASTAQDLGIGGRVQGMALNTAGVLAALIGTKVYCSRDQGRTFDGGVDLSGLSGSQPATIVAQQHLLIVVQPSGLDSTPPTHWVSVDGGRTWE